MMVKAVLFGSLSAVTDLVALERQAFNDAFARHDLGIVWEADEYQHLIRHDGRFKGVTDFVLCLKGLDHAAFFTDLEFCFREAIDGATPTPHVWTHMALEDLARRGVTRCLVSGAERQTVLRVLAAVYPHRASVIFDKVISGEASAAPKPDPRLYEAALEQLRLAPTEVIAVETTADGLAAARAAGIQSAALPGSLDAAELMEAADFTFDSDIGTTLDQIGAARIAPAIGAVPAREVAL